ncbi:unnamed protein product [Larinioides sclopetarius]|uniref:Calcium channel flower n=1 Tax=Larinioides sclopetarius TaxID=280406 RepID=A0AAV1YRW1_9ARAC
MMKPEPAAGPGRPQQTPSDDVPWWLKYGVKFLGSVAALAALALGAMACLTITPRCLLAGIVQIISIIPVSLCAGISTLFGSGLIFVTGSLYGLTSLRRKAPVQDMRMQASSSYNLLQNTRGAGDVEAGQKPGDPSKMSGVI